MLVAITFGLSWRAKVSQERWSRLIGVETEAIATLEELIRAQNAYHAHGGRYRIVTQLLHNESLATIDTTVLRARMLSGLTLRAEVTALVRGGRLEPMPLFGLGWAF